MYEAGPSGLNQLYSLHEVLIRQKGNVGCGKINKYEVVGPRDNVILYAEEETTTLRRIFGRGDSSRSFVINMFDTDDQLVTKLRRPFTYGLDKMEVTVDGQVVSIVRQEVAFFKKVLSVNDAANRLMFRIKGPVNANSECDFDIFTKDKKKIGVIRKKWSGVLQEMFTSIDSFHIRFPLDLDVRYKAVFIGTCLLIDFLYYEN